MLPVDENGRPIHPIDPTAEERAERDREEARERIAKLPRSIRKALRTLAKLERTERSVVRQRLAWFDCPEKKRQRALRVLEDHQKGSRR